VFAPLGPTVKGGRDRRKESQSAVASRDEANENEAVRTGSRCSLRGGGRYSQRRGSGTGTGAGTGLASFSALLLASGSVLVLYRTRDVGPLTNMYVVSTNE
jgi:hypothetical protein